MDENSGGCLSPEEAAAAAGAEEEEEVREEEEEVRSPSPAASPVATAVEEEDDDIEEEERHAVRSPLDAGSEQSPELLQAADLSVRDDSPCGEVGEVGADEDDLDEPVSPASSTGMIDASEFRGLDPGSYPGRMSPGGFSSSSYATLTPLQPLPPISTMSDKFSHYGHHHQHHPGANGGFAPLAMGMGGYSQYDKLGAMSGAMNMSPPHGTAPMLGAGSALPSPPPYSQNGLSVDKGLNGYEPTSYGGSAPQRELTRLGSPQSPTSLHSPMLPALNGLSPHTPPQAHLAAPATPPQPPPPPQPEPKPARVLLPVGTLSDLLRNPKPWSKLKSGRETFRRMYKWLEEPEFQRMSALRLA
ncbi:hypothetical protein V5799_022332, partial [Amblyomma americanum]